MTQACRARSFLSRHATKLVLLVAAAMFIAPLAIVASNQDDIDDLTRDNARAIHRINTERAARISTQKAINAYVCQENNNQDGVLAGLLVFSLAQSPPDAELTEQQRQGKAIFTRALVELQDKTDCGALSFGEIPPPSGPNVPNTLKPVRP
jgi:hypothetical protein